MEYKVVFIKKKQLQSRYFYIHLNEQIQFYNTSLLSKQNERKYLGGGVMICVPSRTP